MTLISNKNKFICIKNVKVAETSIEIISNILFTNRILYYYNNFILTLNYN